MQLGFFSVKQYVRLTAPEWKMNRALTGIVIIEVIPLPIKWVLAEAE
jgi:hypothetical protein